MSDDKEYTAKSSPVYRSINDAASITGVPVNNIIQFISDNKMGCVSNAGDIQPDMMQGCLDDVFVDINAVLACMRGAERRYQALDPEYKPTEAVRPQVIMPEDEDDDDNEPAPTPEQVADFKRAYPPQGDIPKPEYNAMSNDSMDGVIDDEAEAVAIAEAEAMTQSSPDAWLSKTFNDIDGLLAKYNEHMDMLHAAYTAYNVALNYNEGVPELTPLIQEAICRYCGVAQSHIAPYFYADLDKMTELIMANTDRCFLDKTFDKYPQLRYEQIDNRVSLSVTLTDEIVKDIRRNNREWLYKNKGIVPKSNRSFLSRLIFG